MQIVILIVFFDMAAEEKYIGNKEKAKEYLLRAKYQAYKLATHIYMYEFSLVNDQVMENIDKEITEL